MAGQALRHRVFAADRVHLVAREAPGKDLLYWPTVLVDADGTPRRAREFGVWLKFVPDDYREIDPPYPDAVRRVIDEA